MCHCGDAGSSDTRSERKSLPINDQLHLGALALLRQPHPLAASFGRRKGRVNKALIQVDPPLLRQTADDSRQQLSESLVGTPELEPIMHGGLGRKALGQVLPLHAGVQNKEDGLEHRPTILPRPSTARGLSRFQNRL